MQEALHQLGPLLPIDGFQHQSQHGVAEVRVLPTVLARKQEASSPLQHRVFADTKERIPPLEEVARHRPCKVMLLVARRMGEQLCDSRVVVAFGEVEVVTDGRVELQLVLGHRVGNERRDHRLGE